MIKKLVLFDYDDTLVDTFNSRAQGVIEFCHKVHGLTIELHQVTHAWGLPFDRMMQTLGCRGEISKAQYLEIAKRYPMVPFSETRQALSLLSQRGIRLGILTSVAREVLERDLADLSWNQGIFEFIYAQEDTPFHKPNPQVFAPLLQSLPQLSLSQSDVIYIGDRESDALAARGAGIDFIGIARDAERRDLFSDLQVHAKSNLLDIAADLSSL